VPVGGFLNLGKGLLKERFRGNNSLGKRGLHQECFMTLRCERRGVFVRKEKKNENKGDLHFC